MLTLIKENKGYRQNHVSVEEIISPDFERKNARSIDFTMVSWVMANKEFFWPDYNFIFKRYDIAMLIFTYHPCQTF